MEDRETRLRRLRLRSWRRGMKEMDLILGGFADARLGRLEPDQLDAHEALMGELDQDLYDWTTGRADPPVQHAAAIARLRAWVTDR